MKGTWATIEIPAKSKEKRRLLLRVFPFHLRLSHVGDASLLGFLRVQI